MTYHQMMQNHLDTRPPMVILKDLTPMQMLEYSRRPLPVFVNGVRANGPVGAIERLKHAQGIRA
jgi:hypothetical protein